MRQNYFRRERDKFRHATLGPLLIVAGPTILDLKISALDPSKIIQFLSECSYARPDQRFVLLTCYQHPDLPRLLGQLRPRSQRPRRGRAAEKCYELASFHHPSCPDAVETSVSNFRRTSKRSNSALGRSRPNWTV